MQRKGHFDELSKAHLCLTQLQHMLLNKGVEQEALFKEYEHKRKFAHIFEYKRDISSVIRMLRIALRPFVLAVSGSTDLARHVRRCGEAAGFTFPEQPAQVVMRGQPQSWTT